MPGIISLAPPSYGQAPCTLLVQSAGIPRSMPLHSARPLGERRTAHLCNPGPKRTGMRSGGRRGALDGYGAENGKANLQKAERANALSPWTASDNL
jgi:hypothetical protein